MASKKYIRYVGQSLIDFVTTVYGSADEIFDFIKTQSYSYYSQFLNDTKNIFKLDNITDNQRNKFFYQNNTVINTSVDYSKTATIEFVEFDSKTIIERAGIGDFNNDFNSDFFSVDATVVGYNGMNLYLYFKIKNVGNMPHTDTYTVSIGVESKNKTVTVLPNQVVTTYIMFESVLSGTYTATLTNVGGSINESFEFSVIPTGGN